MGEATKFDVSLDSVWPFCETGKDALQVLKAIKREILTDAVAAGVFGSRARGTNDPDSDLDLLILKPGATSWRKRFEAYHPNGKAGNIRPIKSTRYGKPGSGYKDQWIQITRRDPDKLLELSKRSMFLRRALSDTRWLWFKSDQVEQQVHRIIDQISLTLPGPRIFSTTPISSPVVSTLNARLSFL